MDTSQTAKSHVQSVTGILLVSTKQKHVKQHFLLKHLFEIGHRTRYYLKWI